MSNDREPVTAASIAVIAAGFLIYWTLTDFSSTENWSNNYSRLVYALIHTAFPTSVFDLAIEFVASAIGFIAGNKENILLGIFGAVFLYGLTSFVIAWLTAPIN